MYTSNAVSLAQAERGFEPAFHGSSDSAEDCGDVMKASLTDAAQKGKPAYRRWVEMHPTEKALIRLPCADTAGNTESQR
jgi:hypothetical protein